MTEGILAPYAVHPRASRGRRFPVAEHPYRNPFQRDRDRILHSASFRRLLAKTQVLVSDASDHHRTRLTHTLEVAQVSRTLARALELNEDLTEAIALAHDLGHPPFGHAGESALRARMRDHGGFEHNRHGLRLVDELEQRYPGHAGLNLTWEVRASLAYHCKEPTAEEIASFRDPAFPQPFLEAQLVDAADSLAYDAHDLDDALTLGLIGLADLGEVPLWRECGARVAGRHGSLAGSLLQAALVRELLEVQANDLLETTRRRLAECAPASPEDVMRQRKPLADFSSGLAAARAELENFLHERVYRHFRVQRMTRKAARLLAALFDELCHAPGQLPPPYREEVERQGVQRTVCDYLAGLTDRGAQEEFSRLFQPGGFL